MLIEGVPVSIGTIINGEKEDVAIDDRNIDFKQKVISDVDVITVQEDVLFLEGVAFERGVECPSFGVFRRELLLESQNNSYSYPLGSILNKEYSSKYFLFKYLNYTGAGFATSGRKGISLKEIDFGVYKLSTSFEYIKKDRDSRVIPLSVGRELDQKSTVEGCEYRIWTYNNQLFLSKKDISIISNSPKVYFSVDEFKIHEDRNLHVEGVFVITGIEVVDWTDVQYYLILHSSEQKYTFLIGKSNIEALNNSIDFGYAIYEKSYYCTYNRKGVDITKIKAGRYKVSIGMSVKGNIFTQNTDKEIVSTGNKAFINYN